MKLIRYYLILLPLVCLFVFVYNQNTYTAFEPILLENGQYVSVSKELRLDLRVDVNERFYKNLEAVLQYYNESYKVDSHRQILVKRKLNRNRELMANYTHKALDTAWIRANVQY